MDNDTTQMVRCAVCGEFHHPEEMVEIRDGVLVCNECWYENSKCIIVCADCGKVILPDETVTYVHMSGEPDVVPVCADCRLREYRRCEDCEEWYPVGEMQNTVNDGWVCQNCIDDHNWYVCQDCDRYVYGDNATYIEDGDYWVCDDCRDNGDYHQCEDCDNWFNESDLHDDGDDCNTAWHCDSCHESYNYCDCCERWVHDDYYNFDRDMCDRCCEAEDEDDCGHRHGRVHDYHWGRSHGWYRTPFLVDGEKWRDTLTYGVEIEMADGSFDDGKMGDGEKMYHFEHDGSLSAGGVEMITQPCSLLYHKTKFPWESALRGAIDCGFVSHRCKSCSCGFHVHIGRSQLSDLDEFKLDVFFNRYAKYWEHIARRNSTWGLMKNNKSMRCCVEDARFKCGDHGVAVNHSNHSTVEIRIAKGTLRKETVLGTIEAYDASIHYLRSVGAYDLYNKIDIVWDNFVKFVAARSKMYEDAIRMMARLGNYRVSKERVALLDAKRIKKDNWNKKKEGK